MGLPSTDTVSTLKQKHGKGRPEQGGGIFGQLLPGIEAAAAGATQTVPAGGGMASWADQTQPGIGEKVGGKVVNRALQGGTPTQQAWGQIYGGLSDPSFAENFLGKAARVARRPGIGQGYAAGALQDGRPMQAQDAWSMFLANRPEISSDAGLAPYYEDAKRRATEDIRQAGAARGLYGSSAAVDAEQEAITGLEAERANREADYRLRSLGEQRAWDSLMGQLGGSAARQDLASTLGLGNLGLGAEGMDLNRLTAASNMAGRGGGLELQRMAQLMQASGLASGDEINRLMTALSAGTGAQNLRDNRIQGGFNNMMGLGASLFGPTLGYQGDTIGLDAATLNAINDALLGRTGAAVSMSQNQGARQANDVSNWMEILPMFFGGGGGGGMGGGFGGGFMG